MTKDKRNAVFAWLLFGLITGVVTMGAIYRINNLNPGEAAFFAEFIVHLTPVIYSVVAALIISRKPDNVIGWLLMLPALSFFTAVDAFLTPYINGTLSVPELPSLGFLLVLWFSGWNWILIVFPALFIMLLFPTGKPLTSRWAWLVKYEVGMMVYFVLIGTFGEGLEPGAGGIFVKNPIGLIGVGLLETLVAPWLISFPIVIVLSAISLLVRFRRTRGVERQQIKWLFFAAAVFTLFYIPIFLTEGLEDPNSIWTIMTFVGLLAMPLGIAISILRYRLYDIDIIIRRTMQYAILTGLLGAAYFGGVVLLQRIVGPLTGNFNSPLITVVTTLGIAALFTPLRRRVQDFIDRRFFRQKYNAEQALARFAAAARDEVDLDQLTGALLDVVNQTMQPDRVSLWMKR